MCLKEHIEHVIRTLEATEALLPRDSLTQYMIEGAIDELKAIETEDVNNDRNIC